MLNNITIMGRLTREPELRRTNSGTAVTSFTLAVDRDFSGKDGGEKETDFIDCVAWRNTAEFVAKYFTKGRMAVVSGRLQIRSWKDKDGRNRKTAEVVAENVYFADSKPEGSNHGGYNNAPAPGGYTSPAGGYNNTGNNSYVQQNNGYSGYGGGYAAPEAGDQYSVNNYDMLEDEDSQLPF